MTLGPMSNDGGDECLVQRLRALIQSRLTEQRSLDLKAMARAVAMSPRTLQRKLQAQGTAFARILREERQTRTRTLTRQGHRREAIASALGYDSTRSVDRILSHARVDRTVRPANGDSPPASMQ